MFRTFIITSGIALVLACPAYADELAATSKLRAVTVYTNRAMLTRQAVIDVPAGAHTVVFKNLSAELLPDSLRAEGHAATAVKFGALTNKLVAGAELSAPREKELNDKLLALQDQRNVVQAEKDALTAKLEFLKTLAKEGALRTQENIAEMNIKPDQWTGAATAVYESTAETLKSQLARDVTLRGLDDQIEQVETDIDQLQTGMRNSYEVTVPVESATATQLTIDLSYQLPSATWSPVYDARLNTKTAKLELTQYGSVHQNSGEDWDGVALTLSTAQPSRGAGLPDLATMWVNLFSPAPVSAYSSNALAGAAMAPMAMNAMDGVDASESRREMMAKSVAAPAPIAAQFVTAQIDTGGFVGEYKIPGPSTVKADGTSSKLMIGTFDTDSKMQVQVKPQISTDAYLVARATLKGETPILPGPVSLFRDGAFVGQMQLPLLRAGQQRDLAFGIDDQVAVERHTTKDEKSEAGVITRESTIERNFTTSIHNLHTQAVDVAVIENTPVPRDKKITVTMLPDQSTAGYENDVDKVAGLIRWTLPLKPQQKTEVKLGWKVTWPKDQNITGL